MDKKLELEEIRQMVLAFTNIDVKGIGKGNMKKSRAKQIFFRTGFLNGYSGTVLSKYCGLSSRFSAWRSRYYYLNTCKNDPSAKFEWDNFKNIVYGKN